MYCPECRAEYAAGFTQCSDCGVDLVGDLQVVARPAEARHKPPAALVMLGRMWLRPQDFPDEPQAEGRPDDGRDGPEPASTRLIDGGAA